MKKAVTKLQYISFLNSRCVTITGLQETGFNYVVRVLVVSWNFVLLMVFVFARLSVWRFDIKRNESSVCRDCKLNVSILE